MNFVVHYTRWLHTKWPAGTVEKLPLVNPDGSTNVPGLYVVGDLTGIPLLKFAADSGARAVGAIVRRGRGPEVGGQKIDFHTDPRPLTPHPYDVIIIGAGPAGMSAALEAKRAGLRFAVIEAAEPFATIANFPKEKPIYTYPTGMIPAGVLQFRDEVHPKEELLEDLWRQTREQGIVPRPGRVERIMRDDGELVVDLAENAKSEISNLRFQMRARQVILAIGRSGNFRRLNVPGEELDKVYNRLHDPKDFVGKDVLVVGGGDSALETATAVARAGGNVTLSYRKSEFSRPKQNNLHELELMGDSIRVLPCSHVKRIARDTVTITTPGGELEIPNDVVFTMIGREPSLDLLRLSGVKIAGDRGTAWWASLIAFLVFCIWMYHWKKGGVIVTGVEAVDYWLTSAWWRDRHWFPYGLADWLTSLGGAWSNPKHLLGTLRISALEPGFWYSLVYSALVVGFGIDRIRRRPTPYVRLQTVTLILIQIIPLFLLPYLLLPWMGHNGAFDAGFGKWLADTFFPAATYAAHGREYWRSFGFVLAWPLFIWNVFTGAPMWGWLIVSFVQTFLLIPLMIYFWGKGAYCGWICSCGALAETLGDRHRHKMPHGPAWNRLNMLGQVFLLFAVVLLGLRVAGWVWPASAAPRAFDYLLGRMPLLNYVWFVDLLWSGILGVGLYFWFSGRVWCRFACPLAALMHIYARFSRFRILADKKKCISCNVCTSVCHQGIDVMSFANKGLAMTDPQCVRCSACVQMCPTGVLEFGQVDRGTGNPISKDPPWLASSPVLMREIRVNGKSMVV